MYLQPRWVFLRGSVSCHLSRGGWTGRLALSPHVSGFFFCLLLPHYCPWSPFSHIYCNFCFSEHWLQWLPFPVFTHLLWSPVGSFGQLVVPELLVGCAPGLIVQHCIPILVTGDIFLWEFGASLEAQ